jgi:hypothetical protein
MKLGFRKSLKNVYNVYNDNDVTSTLIVPNSLVLGRSQASPSMRLASDRDNAQELRLIEVKINKNGNQHEETCHKLGNTVFFGQSA